MKEKLEDIKVVVDKLNRTIIFNYGYSNYWSNYQPDTYNSSTYKFKRKVKDETIDFLYTLFESDDVANKLIGWSLLKGLLQSYYK